MSDSFAHFEQQLTSSLRFLRVLLKICEHVTQQGIDVRNLKNARGHPVITEACKRKAQVQFDIGCCPPSSSKKKNSRLQRCGCAPSCVPKVYCIN